MKKLLCVVLWVLPVMLFAQSPFDGTWKTNMAESKLSQKPYVFSVNNGMYDCESCVPKINVKADGQDQSVTGQTYDTLAVQVVDANTIHTTAQKSRQASVRPDQDRLTGWEDADRFEHELSRRRQPARQVGSQVHAGFQGACGFECHLRFLAYPERQ